MFELKSHVRDVLAPSYEIQRWDNPEISASLVLASERATGRRVVIKFHDMQEAPETEANRLRNEISVLTRLRHPGIIPVLAAGTSENVIYHVMPFIDGGSISSWMRTGAHPSVQEVASILHQVADALRHIHSRRIVHRDIQMANILISNGHATLIDFGLASETENPSKAWTDIHSLGEVGYEMLTGRNPHGGPNQQGTRTDPPTSNPIPLGDLRPDIPRGFADVVMRTMNPKERWSSADEVFRALGAYSGSKGNRSRLRSFLRRLLRR
jgi:serine/threonine-protein kinase